MKFKYLKIVIFAFVCFVSLAILYVNLENDIEKQKILNQQSTQDYYIVKEYEGKIAVFKNESTIPMNIYDSYVSLLPEHDRTLLENGIRAESTEKLQEIIEDYTS